VVEGVLHSAPAAALTKTSMLLRNANGKQPHCLRHISSLLFVSPDLSLLTGRWLAKETIRGRAEITFKTYFESQFCEQKKRVDMV
jgi:hypothetical protein